MDNHLPGIKKEKYIVPFIIVMTLMLLWNMCRNINDVLIPHLKRACRLTDVQSTFIQSAFFGAYFLLALPAGLYIRRKGYKAGMVAGLVIACVGACLFYPAAQTRYYPLFLGALFIMAAGFTFLETAATPYVAKLGAPEGASSRLSLSAAIGSCGAASAPYIASLLLLHKKDVSAEEINAYAPEQLNQFLTNEASLVKLPYIALAVLFLLAAICILFTKLPTIQENADEQYKFKNVFRYKHAYLGALAVFAYVGAEVGIVSFFIRYAKSMNLEGLGERKAALFITLFMLLVLAGRLSGSWLLKRAPAQRMLLISAGGACVCVALAIVAPGYYSLCLLALVGLFTSVMYPLIFTLSIKDLGAYTKAASSLLIMGIVGGAVVPPLMGILSDRGDIRLAYLFSAACYVYVIYYARKGSRIIHKKPQTISVESLEVV
ncbi:L-fucose:H+ symporter permease [Pinibacter soli]|uniref:L-fucose:H+ symporter permease n=1 Tax=Pinibacter soli TaxID=3044211 RepID=A0ABT6REK4_9BACT|nr:L-fucose:H+ symporter permease [Pinibacter soli]MDI3321008.1 L-fucose:H+ symporter permease [Pinibacter soli]